MSFRRTLWKSIIVLMLMAGIALGQGTISVPFSKGLTAPLTLQDFGSFYVCGERTEKQFSAMGGERPGHIMANAMYVEYMIPPNSHDKPPVIMWSGGCHTSKSFETTPERPDLFQAYVAVEALGSCGAITDAGADFPGDVPVLLMSGDPIDPSVDPPFGIDECKTVVEENPELNLTVDWLVEAGTMGNSHMMMIDTNSKQIAQRLMRWLEQNTEAMR